MVNVKVCKLCLNKAFLKDQIYIVCYILYIRKSRRELEYICLLVFAKNDERINKQKYI